MKSLLTVLKQFSYLFIGAWVAVLLTPDTLRNAADLAGALLVGAILVGIGYVELSVGGVRNLVRSLRRRNHDIAVFEPAPYDKDFVSWVPANRFSVLSALIRLAPNRIRVFNHFFFHAAQHPIVINPYGGVYPEVELGGYRSFQEILNYVRDGGVYVNVADIPFYYAYSHELGCRVDTTPFVHGLSNVRSFNDTLIAKHLGMIVGGVEIEENPDVKRVFILRRGMSNHYDKPVPAVYFEDGITGERVGGPASPVVSVKYGHGRFLFSTIQLNQENLETELEKIIQQADSMIDTDLLLQD